jgi:hypothetical protein
MGPELIYDRRAWPQLIVQSIFLPELASLPQNFGLLLRIVDLAADQNDEAANIPCPPQLQVLDELIRSCFDLRGRKVLHPLALDNINTTTVPVGD